MRLPCSMCGRPQRKHVFCWRCRRKVRRLSRKDRLREYVESRRRAMR